MAQKRYQIRWTANAYEDYESIYDNLLFNWSDEVAEKFRQKVESKLDNLSFQPYLGRRAAKGHKSRSVLVSKYNRLYYRITKDTVELIGIFDMRNDPSKNKFE